MSQQQLILDQMEDFEQKEDILIPEKSLRQEYRKMFRAMSEIL